MNIALFPNETFEVCALLYYIHHVSNWRR